jgi:GT2 family glycosyltransferase
MTTLAFLIPTKDRHGSLARWLPSVLRAAATVDAAVVLCDQSALAFAAPPGVRVLHRPGLGGLPAARNVLLRAVDAEVVCFLDDDSEIAGDFALRLRALADAEPRMLAWGPVVEARSAAIRRLHRLCQLGSLRDPRRLTAGPSDRPTAALFGCCFAVRRAAALAVGFDAGRPGYALGEDLDFFLRLRRRWGPRRVRFAHCLHASHHRDAAGRADPLARGRAKAAFLCWLARRHGGGNPATLVHLALALAAAAGGGGQEPGSWAGVLAGLLAPGRKTRAP